MKSLLISVVFIAILVGFVLNRSPAGKAGQGAPTQAQDLVAFRDQAGLTLRVRSQINLMQQCTASGAEATAAGAILRENDAIKSDCERIATLRKNAGERLEIIPVWDEFLRLDTALRTAP